MKVRFSPEAQADLLNALDYIGANSPKNANLVAERVFTTLDRLTTLPMIGRTGRMQGTRELIVSRTSHILIYEVKGDTLHVVRLLHASRDWP